MKTKLITTSRNISTEIDYSISGFVRSLGRWEIRAILRKRDQITGKVESTETPTITLVDRPEITEEIDGETVVTQTELTQLTDFMAAWDGSIEGLHELTLQTIAERRNITAWDESVIDDIANDPDAEEVKPWESGELVAFPNRRDYEGTIYDVIQPHMTQALWTPPATPALWKVSLDQGGEEYPDWVQPTGAHDAYPLGAKVKDGGKCWESLNAANVWPPAEGALWTEIECP